MIVNKAYKYELKVNETQRNLLRQHAGTSRFAYNWGLNRRMKQFSCNQGKARFTNYFQQHKELNKLKETHFPWMYDVSKCAPQEALRDLETAFKNFQNSQKGNRKWKYPKFKKKGSRDSFRLNGTVKVFAKNHSKYPKRVQLPRLKKLKLKENPQKLTDKISKGLIKILSATISRRVNRWFVSFTVEENINILVRKKRRVVGVDLGLKTLAVLSDGTEFKNGRALKRNLSVLKKLGRSVSRKLKGSSNRTKAIKKLGRLHFKISNQRKDVINKLTTYLVNNYDIIKIEDLNVKGMIKNRNLAQSISDAGFHMLRRQLEYKCEWYNAELIVIDRWFPSSKTCSSCGQKKKILGLGVRTYYCANCGVSIDRDLNAAINIKNYGTQSTTGLLSSSPGLKIQSKQARGEITNRYSMKQAMKSTTNSNNI